MTDIGFGDFIPKLKEHQIDEPEVFFNLSEDTMIELLEIKTEGKKFRLKKALTKIKADHDKKLAEIEEEKIKRKMGLIGLETFESLQKKSSVTY